MIVLQEEGARPVKMWVDEHLPYPQHPGSRTPNIEHAALQQLKNIARLPFVHPNGVAAMPDVHLGIGATVGSVIATEGAIIPAAVGVDIGCGMEAIRTSLKAADLPDSLSNLRHSIERGVPLGAGGRQGAQGPELDALLKRVPRLPFIEGFTDRFCSKMDDVARQVGTLGSGNHFIELCLDQEQRVWVMLHSGSRGVGNRIGTHYIAEAKREAEKWFIQLPDKDLAYFPEDTPLYTEYTQAVSWAQEFARANRKWMMEQVLNAMQHLLPAFHTEAVAISCHHNYVERENHYGRNVWVTRKGAIRARPTDFGIIPGSMGTRSYIVRGKGNPEAYHSCSHGAGRRMSRGQAKQTFTVEDLKKQTEGVECRKDDAVLDEIPGAYKDIDQVMENQKDLVEVLYTLKQIVNVKGA